MVEVINHELVDLTVAGKTKADVIQNLTQKIHTQEHLFDFQGN